MTDHPTDKDFLPVRERLTRYYRTHVRSRLSLRGFATGRTGSPRMARMTTSAHLVADEIRGRIPGVGDVKLHKLLYYAQGHHLAAFGEPLFGETISAWDMGPVVGVLWHSEHHDEPQLGISDTLDEASLNTVGYVVGRYGGLTGQDLIRMSHNEPPWQKANVERWPGTSVRIPVDSIRDFFESVADEDEETGPPLDRELLKNMLEGAPARRLRQASVDSPGELSARIAALSG
jgi:uncharacterized phage-associated protein